MCLEATSSAFVPSQCCVANCRQSSGSWQRVPTTSTGPKETGGWGRGMQVWNLPPSPPGVALGRNGSCLLAPGPRRPTNNKVQSLGPVTVTGGGDHLFLKKKKKDKKVAASYKHRDLCFKMLRRMICPGPAHQKQAWPGACGLGVGPLLLCGPASKHNTYPLHLMPTPTQLRSATATSATPGCLLRDMGEPEG